MATKMAAKMVAESMENIEKCYNFSKNPSRVTIVVSRYRVLAMPDPI